MTSSFIQVILSLIAGVAVIIVLTTKYRVHAFFALMIACFVTGLGVQLPVQQLVNTMKDGFGNIMRSLGFIIVLGTTLGLVLEHSGCTRVMAATILKLVGKKNASWAISITGFIVGLPVFCDSGYIVLNGLTKSLSRQTSRPIAVMSVSLATGLYAVHCLIPPHPGAAAAATTIGADIGRLMIFGIMIALPAMIVGHYWANYAGKRFEEISKEDDETADQSDHDPGVVQAFLPVILPILLIAAKSFLAGDPATVDSWINKLLIIGDPVLALAIGVLLAFSARRRWNRSIVSHLLQESAEKAGGILVIIGAGGAFGAVLAATGLGTHFSEAIAIEKWGIFFPFILTFILKTAQGSSTVAIITASSIVLPLLPALHLDSSSGKMLAVLSMGAGSMMISHANDAYFWVITKFANIDIRATLKVYTVASVLMGLTSLLFIFLLSLLLL